MFKILITGLGTSGKSTYRRRFVSCCKRKGLTIHHYDADGFGSQIRSDDDRDEKILSLGYEDEDLFALYVVEDVRGLSEGCFRPIDYYDFVIYVKPKDFLNHARMILSRAARWYELGKFDWMRETGWKGTGKPHDWHNLWPITKIVMKRILSLLGRFKVDLSALSRSKKSCLFVQSRYAGDGVRFNPEP